MRISLSKTKLRFTGPGGSLLVPDDDEVCRRLAMLIEGECEEPGPAKAAQKYGFSRQRYYQLRANFYEQGAPGLLLQKSGPKTDYRRTDQVVRLVIRCRFLDPDCSPEVIAQKIRQQNHFISQRSVERIIADYGLQKKSSTVLIRPIRLSLFKPSARAKSSAPCPLIPRAWNDRSANC